MTDLTNIFNLPNPMLYRCHVHRYFNGLSRLYIRVFKGHDSAPTFYLLFSDLGYYEGPITWEGADFGIATHHECITLMLQVGLIGEAILQFPDAYAAITETAKLYVVRTLHTPVRFIAGSATLLPDIPAELK
ncbi:MAG TPA: hypothetical protein VHL11_02010 [Phototrophicaceae bacterium]|jgi:hypothetical protein|nr:hypothetical protein [Phototrophicaceae bacterium]